MIHRKLHQTLVNRVLDYNKIIILYGSRQVGKTTLIKEILKGFNVKKLEVSGDEIKYSQVLSSRDLDQLKLMVEGYELLFIDEAQRIENIGVNLKLLHDALPELKIIVTGSSTLELIDKVKEPLTGRTWTHILYPVSLQELNESANKFEIKQQLGQYLRFGTYPEIFSYKNQEEKISYLKELTSSYLYKDILELTSIKHSNKLQKLLQLLSFQLGSQVSLNELGNSLGITKETVGYYIDLLEKSFVIFRLSGFSRNLRKEITKMDKIYFYDLGVRNAVIDNYNSLELRNDIGQLWENFLMIERRKKLEYDNIQTGSYFWRTYSKAELDYVEDRMGQLHGYEFKFKSKKSKVPSSWIKTYPDATFDQINPDNFLDFTL